MTSVEGPRRICCLPERGTGARAAGACAEMAGVFSDGSWDSMLVGSPGLINSDGKMRYAEKRASPERPCPGSQGPGKVGDLDGLQLSLRGREGQGLGFSARGANLAAGRGQLGERNSLQMLPVLSCR